MSSSLLVVVAAGKCPHLQSRYFGAFPECTQWHPFIRSDCRGLCFMLHSTHKRSNKDIAASSVSYTTHIFTCRAPRCEHNTSPCSFIRKTEWLRKAKGNVSCEKCSLYNPIDKMLTADQTDQKQAEKHRLQPREGMAPSVKVPWEQFPFHVCELAWFWSPLTAISNRIRAKPNLILELGAGRAGRWLIVTFEPPWRWQR